MVSVATIAAYEAQIRRAQPIDLSRHYAIGEELWSVEQRFATGRISKEERDAVQASLREEERDAIVAFDTEEEFAAFCAASPRLQEQYLHEQEHATVYRKRNIPCTFGFVKIISEQGVGLIPWIHPQWPAGIPARLQLEITIQSLEAATEHSQGDLQDIAALRAILEHMQ